MTQGIIHVYSTFAKELRFAVEKKSTTGFFP
jgi:hypothetical protein